MCVCVSVGVKMNSINRQETAQNPDKQFIFCTSDVFKLILQSGHINLFIKVVYG